MPIEHPEPTPATVKELYGNAYRCAFPDCRRPLYKVDPDNGSRTLNSRVSHIHARREGGPRWEPTMSADKNRSVENLVLLCIEHSYEVDDPDRVADFGPDLMRKWKANQLAEFDRLHQGWALDEGEAREAAEASFELTAQTIVLGGAGGAAPGAGGGGGGAIGSGALGGAGGRGGDVNTALDGQHGAPGAGGGGGGVVGDNAVGGAGGEGGEMVSAVFRIANLPDTLEVYVGPGGEGGVGRDGEDGEDTVIRDAVTGRELLRSKGGKGGRAGAPQLGPPSEIPPTVSALLLANYAEIRDGLVYMMGGGWEFFSLPEFPGRVSGFVVSVVDFDPPNTRDVEEYAGELVSPTGEVVASWPLTFRKGTAQLRLSQWAHPLSWPVNGSGNWKIRILWEGRNLASTQLLVRRV